MIDQYSSIAELYDAMAADPGLQAFYREWRRALLEAARVHHVAIRTLVDLACGTGNTAIPWLTRRDWRIVGIDSSPAMLREARRKSRAVRWHRQDLTLLRLARCADAVTCHGDALNHVLDARSLQRVFVGVARILRGGGLFLFDVNTVNWLRWVAAREKMFRAGPGFFVASTIGFNAKRGVATFHQTWFVARGRLFEKRESTVRERAYSDANVRRMLRAAGFRVANVEAQRRIEGKPARLLYTAIRRRDLARHDEAKVASYEGRVAGSSSLRNRTSGDNLKGRWALRSSAERKNTERARP